MVSFPSQQTESCTRRVRRGISILEVLVSIGLLTLGLLSVVVLIPIAAKNLRRGIAIDEATAVARCGVAEFQARGANNIQRWLRYQPGAFTPAAGGPITNLWGVQTSERYYPSPPADPNTPRESYVNPSWAFCIDPLMYESVQVQDASGRNPCFFPYQPQSPGGAVHPNATDVNNGQLSSTFGRMIRVTMNWNAIDWRQRNVAFGPLNLGLASSMCQSYDDLLLTSIPQEPSEGLLGITVSATEAPAAQYDVNRASWDLVPLADRVKRDAAQRTSWFATLVPLPGSVADGSRYYTLSVAVCENRDLTIDASRSTTIESITEVLQNVESERTVGVRFVGGGLAGGEVQLVSKIPADPVNLEQTALAMKSLSKLRSGNWILISGPGYGTGHIFYWYRVGTIDQEPGINPFNSAEVVRNATLRGPDWPMGVSYAAGPYAVGEATIVSNVINVFEQTVELRGE